MDHCLCYSCETRVRGKRDTSLLIKMMTLSATAAAQPMARVRQHDLYAQQKLLSYRTRLSAWTPASSPVLRLGHARRAVPHAKLESDSGVDLPGESQAQEEEPVGTLLLSNSCVRILLNRLRFCL